MTARATHGDALTLYSRKLHSLQDAVGLLHASDTIAVPIAAGQPSALLSALAERSDYQNLVIFTGLVIEPYPVLTQPGVRLISGFFGPVERMLKSMGGTVEYLPADFIGWERYALRAKPRVVASAVAPMDDHGYLSFGLHAGAIYNAFMEAAHDPDRLAIAEVNPSMPHVLGLGRFGGHRVHISELDCVVESDHALFELPPMTVTDEDQAIAEHVEHLIENGATLQIGIGGVPNIVAALLAEGKKGDFGIHTEMMVDGIMRLHEAGKITNHKGVYDGFSLATFAAGSKELYKWMHRNPEVRLLPVLQVNDPAVIRRNRKMVSINGALAVDFSGQVMADTVGPRQYSGVGGHELFVIGAGESMGGKSFVCLHSTARVDGKIVSTIVPALPVGTPVTTPRHHVQYVVTEHGVAEIGMLTNEQRAEALINIAHPDLRDELRAGARGSK
jgi:acyl-CoA hydrolase